MLEPARKQPRCVVLKQLEELSPNTVYLRVGESQKGLPTKCWSWGLLTLNSFFQDPGASGVTAQQGDAQLGEVENLEDFAYSPAPRGVTVKCRVTRDKKGMDRGLFPTYYMHLEKEENRKVQGRPRVGLGRFLLY